MNARIAKKIEEVKRKKLYADVAKSLANPLPKDTINLAGTITREDVEAISYIGNARNVKVSDIVERQLLLSDIRKLGFRSIKEYVSYAVHTKKTLPLGKIRRKRENKNPNG